MTLNYDALAKTSAQALEKDLMTFEEGETIGFFAKYEGDVTSDGHLPFVTANMHNGALYEIFKRGAQSLDTRHKLVKDDRFIQALPFDLPEVCALGQHVEGLDAEQKKKTQANPQFFWVFVPLSHRREEGEGQFVDIYKKPKYIIAKMGSNSKPCVHRGMLKLLRKDPERFFNDDNPQLVSITRIGKGMTGTSWNVKEAPSEYDGYEVSAEISIDIEEATAKEGPCDLINVIATGYCPNPEEIATKLHGKSAASGMQEG